MLTCDVPGISRNCAVPSWREATRSEALPRMDSSSSEPTITNACGGKGGGSLKRSFSAETPWAERIGAGEMAIRPATGTRDATRSAMAPPIECPARIVRSAWIIPRASSSRRSDSVHCSARAGENGPGVLMQPGRSGTYTRNPCSANPRATYDMIFLFAEIPWRSTTAPETPPSFFSTIVVSSRQPPASTRNARSRYAVGSASQSPRPQRRTPASARMACCDFITRH